MTSITPRLNCSYQRVDGRYPLVIQIIRHRQKREIKTSILLYKDEFNNQLSQAVQTPNHYQAPGIICEINRYLAQACSELQLISEELYRQKGESYTAADVAEAYKLRRDLTQLFAYANSLITTLRNQGHSGTAGNYQSACEAFAHFHGSHVLSFNDFTSDLIDRFADYLRQNKKQPNTIVCYLNQLRAFYNKALRADIVPMDLHPFRNQTIRKEPTRKHTLSKEYARHLQQADLTGFHEDVALVRDLFMGSIHLRGMCFVDLCYLRKENIEGDYLFYRRRKTGQVLRVRLEQPLKKLLASYSDPNSPYLFPILRGNNGDEYKAYLNAKGRFDKRIHELGIRLHLDFPLSFHLARHTWTTLAHNAGIEVAVISRCLGHLSEKTTRDYLAEISPKKVDYANHTIINILK